MLQAPENWESSGLARLEARTLAAMEERKETKTEEQGV